jgi:hypothetical protein
MDYSKMTDKDWKYPPTSGDLAVSEDPKHVMHWEEYGNPKGEPVIFILFSHNRSATLAKCKNSLWSASILVRCY